MSDVSVLVLMSPYSTPLLVFLHQDIPKHCHWHKAKCKVTHGSDLKIPKKNSPLSVITSHVIHVNMDGISPGIPKTPIFSIRESKKF